MSALQPIMIVDDTHDDLFILKRLLARTGAKNAFITFDHGDEAKRFLEAAVRTPETNLIPAAIFSDKRMPGVNGFDLVEWLRRQPALVNVPVYLLTSSVEPGDAERAKELGATGFFEKFPPQHVIDELFQRKPKG
jgi:CheY-like chemotaxis protein